MLENIRTRKVYLDHNATTPTNERVIQGLGLVSRIWGNPSSIHYSGRGPKSFIRDSRKALAEALCVSPLEIVYTSGGSEGNNTIIQGLYQLSLQENSQFKEKIKNKNEFITTSVEHPSVLKTMQHLEKLGAKVHYLSVNREGQIDLDSYLRVLSEKTLLVSVMYANNETGVVLPVEKMAKLAHRYGAFFHSDCVQALGKVTLNLKKLEVDYATFSAHKVYALKGIGALYINKGSPFQPLLIGGAQERSRRAGTENVMGIWSFGEMAKELINMPTRHQFMKTLRDYFETEVVKKIENISVTSQLAERLPNTSSLIIAGVDGETLLMNLDIKGFAVSTGAACSSGNPEPSPVLLHIGLSREEAQSSLRLSLGWETTKDQIDDFITVLDQVVTRLRSLPKENLNEANMKESIQDADII